MGAVASGHLASAAPSSAGVLGMIYREAGQFRTSYVADQALFPIRQERVFIWVVIILAFVAVPVFASEYLLRAILIPFLILAIAAIGLNLLVGYCGQISLG